MTFAEILEAEIAKNGCSEMRSWCDPANFSPGDLGAVAWIRAMVRRLAIDGTVPDDWVPGAEDVATEVREIYGEWLHRSRRG